jgi:multiple sugar transport system ATP-binding protein
MSSVHLRQLSKRYNNTPVLEGVSLDIRHGEFVVLVGPSGCGKSTLLRMICGLEDISGGELMIDDQVVNHLSPAERGIAMVFQSYALYPHMTVYRNMAFGLQVQGQGKSAIDERVRSAAKALHIDHLLDRLPRELSGGQRQRVAIGRAIVRQPRLFLFDEPLSNLDASLRVKTRIELARLHRELNATMVYVTHDQVEAMTLGDKIVVLNEGRVQQAGTPLELYQQPANRFVATFIGSPTMNLLPAVVASISDQGVLLRRPDGQQLMALVDSSQLQLGDSVEVGVRPEHVLPYEGQSLQGESTLSGTVMLVEHLGESNLLYLQLDDGSELVVRGDGDKAVRLGQRMVVHVDMAQLHVFRDNGLACRRLAPGNMLLSRHQSEVLQ